MIVTTTPTVDGRIIESYLGLVSGSAMHNVGGLIGEGYLDGNQSSYISNDITAATKRMIIQAIALKADAVVGVQVSTGASAVANQIITTCIGTAVKLTLSSEEIARLEREKQEIEQKEKERQEKAALFAAEQAEREASNARAFAEDAKALLTPEFFEEIEKLESAGDIYDYISSLDSPCVEELKKSIFDSVKIEMRIGNAKNAAVSTLKQIAEQA